ncbi:hypothetical protein VTO73DRAFT_5259 [Trametes versicolor]
MSKASLLQLLVNQETTRHIPYTFGVQYAVAGHMDFREELNRAQSHKDMVAVADF